jgi:hypothetical protein
MCWGFLLELGSFYTHTPIRDTAGTIFIANARNQGSDRAAGSGKSHGSGNGEER